jgi:hypothetical protein
VVVAVVLVFAGCLRITWGQTGNSDAAGNALEAWAMLHGNWLLHGWVVTDVSFYTTELPEYALVEAVRGLRPEVAHIAAALTYTLIVAGAALLARGTRRGREGLVAAGIAAAIIVIPQPGEPTALVMSTPDHTGTVVPVLVTLLVLDRVPRRWWVPVLTALLLAWGLIADPLVLLVGVAPIVIVCGLRFVAAAAWFTAGTPQGDRRWFEAALAVAAVVAVGIESAATHLIRALGGWTARPVAHHIVGAQALPKNTALTAEGVLALFGADFTGQSFGLSMVFALLHLVGVALVVAGMGLALRRFIAGDLIAAILATAIVVNIAAYMVTYQISAINTTREIAPVMGLGAALAGRVMAGPLLRAHLERLVAIGVACYLAMGVVTVARAPQAPPGNQLAAWLEAHDLRTGLAGYWQSSWVVLDSGGQIQMGTLTENRAGFLVPRHWENDIRWFSPRAHDATFVVTVKGGRPPSYITESEALRTFGPPVRRYGFEGLVILVYYDNLLDKVGRS